MAWEDSYCTSAELKSFVRVPDTVDDVQIADAIVSASRAVDLYAGRQFGLVAAAEARVFDVVSNPTGRQEIFVDDFQTAVGLVIKLDTNRDYTYATTIVNAECLLTPTNAAQKLRPFQSILLPRNFFFPTWPDEYGHYGYLLDGRGSAQVTAQWGWTTVPTTVKHATLLQASRFLKRRDAPLGIAGSPELGNELRLLRQLDVDVMTMLDRYRRHYWGFA